MSNGFWMAKGSGCLTDGEMGYTNSPAPEHKRSHQWFLDAIDTELVPNKKQAVETSTSRSLSGVPTLSPWDNGSQYQSAPNHFTDNRLFGSHLGNVINYDARNIQSIDAGNIDMTRRGTEGQFGADPSIALSMSHTMEDTRSCLTYGGYRKIRVNQVKESESGISLPIDHSFNKGENTTISFGGFQDEHESDPSGRIISSYDLLMSQSAVNQAQTGEEKQLIDSNRDVKSSRQVVNPASQTPRVKMAPKPDKKAAPLSNFPPNVRALLATHVFDGIPVKYVTCSSQELRGIIKGPGYLCSCQSCNFSKILNAFEFERHAGAKTKLPNNRIFFENGKTMYGIVQELRNTPPDLLFDVIPRLTGSPINQKAFDTWKESYQAAIRELQRIYGKEDLSQIFTK